MFGLLYIISACRGKMEKTVFQILCIPPKIPAISLGRHFPLNVQRKSSQCSYSKYYLNYSASSIPETREQVHLRGAPAAIPGGVGHSAFHFICLLNVYATPLRWRLLAVKKTQYSPIVKLALKLSLTTMKNKRNQAWARNSIF